MVSSLKSEYTLAAIECASGALNEETDFRLDFEHPGAWSLTDQWSRDQASARS